MGAKSRSNYALGITLTDEEFDAIFRKDKIDAKPESKNQEEREQETDLGTVDNEINVSPRPQEERD